MDSNSIVFVNTKQYFRLPNYIAVRFNLRINHVHRGVLLGTGPLVDPGFVGRLLIPLHNLTANKYALRSGDPIAWVDFTKISPHEWTEEYDQIKADDNLSGTYVTFPEDKKNLTSQNYLTSAYNVKFPKGKITKIVSDLIARPHRRSIRSSIPEALESAKKEMRRLRNFAYASIIVVGVSAVLAGVALVVGGLDLITQLNTRIQTTSEFAANALAEVRELKGRINTGIRTEIKDEVVAELAATLDALREEQTKLENDSRSETSATKKEISQLRKRISELVSKIEVLTKLILSKGSKPEQPAN